MTEVVTIGFIPNDCSSQEIACGDSQSSGTTERSFRIGQGWVTGIDCSLRIQFTGELVVPNSPFLGCLSDYLMQCSLTLKANTLYNALSALRSGQERFSSKFEIIESEGGVFSNQGFKFNGLYYLRRYEEGDDNSVLNEFICVKVF